MWIMDGPNIRIPSHLILWLSPSFPEIIQVQIYNFFREKRDPDLAGLYCENKYMS
jgi:hypothetical protein